jgi:nucleoid DNA-binding protein
MASITKREMVSDLSDLTGLTQADVSLVVENFIDLVAKRLGEGSDVTFRTFGTFEVKVAKAKIGRNPNLKNSEVTIPARCTVKFKPGRELKDLVAKVPVAKIK